MVVSQKQAKTIINVQQFISGDSRDGDAKRAFQSLLFLSLTVPSGPRWAAFVDEVTFRAKRDYNYNYDEEVNSTLFSSLVSLWCKGTFTLVKLTLKSKPEELINTKPSKQLIPQSVNSLG